MGLRGYTPSANTGPKNKRTNLSEWGHEMPRITEMWAWVLADGAPDNEGVPTMRVVANGQTIALPAMGADFTRASDLRSFAQTVANRSKQPLKLIKCVPLFIGSMMESLTSQGRDSHMKQLDGSLAARISMPDLKIIKEWRKLSPKYQRPEAFECAAASWGVLYGIAVTQLHEVGGRKALEAFEEKIKEIVFGEKDEEE
ncbi:hypothetical protein Q3G72_032733 [Acer saccharum]|nr:hypothetical protein Q3G72_010270 [Acer saccharum]KAK1548643.1 hypothetical protein Q3G72_032733 [Acer saccharum]